MKNRNTPDGFNPGHGLAVACAAALALAATVALPPSALADPVTPPPVPDKIAVPAGSRAFLLGHAIGTQNYVCLPSAASATGFAYALFTPQATLFSDENNQVTTHYFSPSPFENGKVRATWEHSGDTSTVWAKAAIASDDPKFVAPGAIPWVRLEVKGQDGPKGGHKLTATTFVHRVNTAGGLAPSTGCAQPADVGSQAFVPYTADYIFYTDR
jgi:hypothetical protein